LYVVLPLIAQIMLATDRYHEAPRVVSFSVRFTFGENVGLLLTGSPQSSNEPNWNLLTEVKVLKEIPRICVNKTLFHGRISTNK
jgi:hypothetical protein